MEELDCRLSLLDQATKPNIDIGYKIPFCNLDFNIYILFICLVLSVATPHQLCYTVRSIKL